MPISVIRGLPGTGKSTRLIDLARAAASQGRRVVTIACSTSRLLAEQVPIRAHRLVASRQPGVVLPLDHFVTPSECAEILGKLAPGAMAAFDEAQHFGAEVVPHWIDASRRGIDVVVAMPSPEQLRFLEGQEYSDVYIPAKCQRCAAAEATKLLIGPADDTTLVVCGACADALKASARREIVQRLQEQPPHAGEKAIYQPVDIDDCAGWRVIRDDSARRAALMADVLDEAGCLNRRRSGGGGGGDLSYLDVGCNTGYFCHKMARLGFRSEGVDVVEGDVAVARLLDTYCYGDASRFRVSDAYDYLRDSRDRLCDVTSAFAVIQWVMIQSSVGRGLECLEWLFAKTTKVCFLEMGYSSEAHYKGRLPIEIDRQWVIDLMKQKGGFSEVRVYDGAAHRMMRDFFVGFKAQAPCISPNMRLVEAATGARTAEAETILLNAALAEQSAWARRCAAEVVERDATIRELQKALAEQSAWAKRSADDVVRRDATIRQLQDQLAAQRSDTPRG